VLRLYRKPSKGLIGVDISSTSVKVLELSVKNNRYWVDSYTLVPLPEGSVVEKNILNPEAVGDALERAVNLANVQSTDVALAVPTSMVITKIIEMDADMNDDEREIQIRDDAEQYCLVLSSAVLYQNPKPNGMAVPTDRLVAVVANR
jgi:type IV pilus assembly protein PilM